uniref:Uncharacterized protein n=1 Tax=Rhizophora mucronata TaxID=61149 RepID=A0A2P2QPE5_RHIMU
MSCMFSECSVKCNLIIEIFWLLEVRRREKVSHISEGKNQGKGERVLCSVIVEIYLEQNLSQQSGRRTIKTKDTCFSGGVVNLCELVYVKT